MLSSEWIELLEENFEAISLPSLLKDGIAYSQKGCYTEAIAYFTLARKRLTSPDEYLAQELDKLLQLYTHYVQAQQFLLEANRRFFTVETEHQACLANLTELLYNSTIANSIAESPISNRLSQKPVSNFVTNPNKPNLSSNSNAQECLALHFNCFGRFEVKRQNQPVLLCANRKGQAILRYLINQPHHQEMIEVLMELLWPEDEPKISRHKLKVAVSALRVSLNRGFNHLPGADYILCENQFYRLNPQITFSSDVDEFLTLYRRGCDCNKPELKADLYQKACRLYCGPFLPEDTYADWALLRREQLTQIYLSMCNKLAEYYLQTGEYNEVITWATNLLKENRCDEAAHNFLIQAYTAQGRRSEAIRQYHNCEQILSEELSVTPLPETIALLNLALSSENCAK